MFYRDVSLAMWEINCSHYIDLLVKEESIKVPLKAIVKDSFEYTKKTSKSIDNILENCSIFWHKKFT